MKTTTRILTIVIMLALCIQSVLALSVSVNDYDPKPAEAGKAVNVWFKIDNPSDDPQEEVSIEITPQDGLTLTPGESARQFVGIVPGRTSQIVQFRLLVNSEAFDGAHTIEARLLKGSQAASKADLSIEVTDKDFKDIDLSVGDIESDPTRIKPDDENVKLEVTIQNLGDGKAQGVKTELTDLPQGITLSESYSGTSLLGNVEADSTAIATFYVDIDKMVQAREYTANIRASYKYKPDETEDDYLFEESVIPLTLSIKPVPLYEITKAELNPGILSAGDRDVKLRLTIKNIGEEKGESVRVKAYGKTEQPIDYDQSSDFVSPILEPGEEGQATLQFKIEDEANLQKYLLDLEIKSIVNDDVITYQHKVPVTVTNPKPNNPWGLVIVGLILIAGVMAFTWYRNRKKTTAQPKKVKGSYGKSYLEK